MQTNPSLISLSVVLALGLSMAGCSDNNDKDSAAEQLTQAQDGGQATVPPDAMKQEYVVDSPVGQRIDPYYWMRDDERTDPDVLAYLNAENAYYDDYRASYQELTEQLEDELIGRIKQDDASVPYTKGDYQYYTRYEEGKEYPIHARKPVAGGEEQILLDVNELAEGHDYYNAANLTVSPDQNLLAFMVDTNGRRQYQLWIKDLASGELQQQQLSGLSSSIAWTADSSALFVIENDPQTLLSTTVFKHQLGQSADQAELIYEETDPSFYMWLSNSKDQQFVKIQMSSTVADELRILDTTTADAQLTVFAPRERGVQYSAEHLDDRWIIRTDWNAPNFKLMQVADNAVGDKSSWQQLIEEDDEVFIQSFVAFDDYLAINERSDGLRRIRVMPWGDLQQQRYIESEEVPFVASFERNVEQDTNTLRYSYSSLKTPTTIYAYDMKSGERELLKQTEILGGFDSSDYRTKRVWAVADDGTEVPVSLLFRSDFEQDGTAPLYQYAYGSYGSSSDPSFRSTVLSLVDRGFVYAIAHIRGGQEMGRQWYEEGKLLNKKNTFTDFIDVTEYLVEKGYADPDKVFAMGGSAGGLLMGAVANMAPDLYRGMVAHVPFVDVVTTMLDESIPLTTNEFDEWGNPKQKAYYDYMLSYSPYDNVQAQDYPALMVTTGLHDSQVQYFEPAKWVAKLRDVKTDNNPLVFSTNMEAGHGGSSGRFSRLEEIAEEYAFILDLLKK
ncbi:MAG: S9 family peptidase [Pseudomonadota bacterium]